jgi:hypothetical protein
MLATRSSVPLASVTPFSTASRVILMTAPSEIEMALSARAAVTANERARTIAPPRTRPGRRGIMDGIVQAISW